MNYASHTVLDAVDRQYCVKQGSYPNNLESTADERYWKKYIVPSMQ